jgi:hypothetical protein
MKRRTFAAAGGSSNKNRSGGGSKKKVGHSSSSSDGEGDDGAGPATDLGQRYNSMSNLGRSKSSLQGSSRDGNKVRKANSVLGLQHQKLGPDITENPQLMQTFQTELENQFEVWKEEFLQRHRLENSSQTGSRESNNDEPGDKVCRLLDFLALISV